MKRLLSTLTLVLFSGLWLNAQIVLNTNAVLGAPNNGTGACTFNFENTNVNPVEINEIASFINITGSATCEVWIHPTPINGVAPGPITVANGWTLVATDTFTATANVLTTMVSGASINIPAGANYGVCVAAYSGTAARLRYYGTGTTAFSDTVSAGGCNIYLGSNVSYGYTATFPSPIGSGTANHPRAFTGTVTFSVVGPCTNPPTAGTTTASSAVVCAGSNVTLGLTGNTSGLGQTYQWQSSSSISGPYTNIDTPQTAPTYAATVAANTYYRCEVTCGGSTDSSAPVLVNATSNLPAGIYTINSALATSGTNYQSFADAVSALSCGIAGPVVFNVIPGSGPYTEQVILTPVLGSSATNTITFNGNSEVLTFGSTNTNERAVIKLNGADHFIINELTVAAPDSTYGFGIQLLNDADSNIISACVLNLNTTSTSTNYAGIVISNSATSATGTGNSGCDNNLIIGNTINGGYYGITLVANGVTNMIYDNQVIDNQVRDFYSYGIYMNGNDGTLVEGNDISRPNRTTLTTFYGIYHTAVSYNVVVSANRIHNPFDGNPASTSAAYGIYHTNTDAIMGSENTVVNNLIYNFNGSGTQNGFLTGGSDYTRYYHNTVSLDDNTTTCASCATRGFYLQTNAAAGLEIINNNFTLTRTNGGESQGIYFAVAGSNFVSDYNNIYVATSGSLNAVGYINAASHISLADWITASANDTNSLAINPVYTNPSGGNYAPSNPALNNQGTPIGVTLDITNTSRSATTPDIGAFEFDVAATDAGVNGITTASCPGTDSVYVTVQNFGLTTITSVVVNCTANGIPTSNSGNTFSVNIASSGSEVVNVGTTTFATGNSYQIIASTSMPNGSSDPNTANDTSMIVANTSLTGTYTINASVVTGGTNYQSFTDAANALNTYGVCGPVVINVVPGYGPYNEQIVFNQINGASPTNTITINGNGEILTYNPTSTFKYIVRLNGTDYMTIDSLKIVGADPTYGFGILLSANADYNVIRNCEIDLSAITSTGTTNSAGICASATVTSPIAAGANASFNQIVNNTIKGGALGGPYYGITLYGNTGAVGCNANLVSGNRVTDFYNTGIRLNLTSACDVLDNDVSRPTISSATGLEGIYLTGATNPKTTIARNRVHNSHGGNPSNTAIAYPIDITSDGGGVTQEILVANNAVYDINHNGSVYAIYVSSSLYSNFYHNSISLDNAAATGTTTSRGFYLLGTCDSINIKNNAISITRGGSGVMYGLYYASVQPNNRSDYNVVYVNPPAGSGFFGYNGTAQATIADWWSTSLRDSNSVAVNPLYTSAVTGNLTPSSAAINNIGENLTAIVPFDILGAARLTTPDPGAFEFTPAGDDAGITAIASSICTGTDSVYVTVQNYGSANLNSVVVSLTSNGTPSSLSGSVFGLNLLPGEDTTLNLGTITFVAGNTYTLQSFTSQPNATADANNANDTVAIIVNLGLSGNYTINSAVVTGGTNYQSFTDAANDLNTYGICGPVLFNVVQGSGPYSNQQIVINELVGSSAINTVTFKGNNEVFTFLSTNSNNRAGIRLNGADYVTIDSLVVIAEGTTTTEYGFGIQLMNGADYNTISNNDIRVDTSTTSTNYAGIAFSNSVTSAITAGNNGNGNTIINNRVTGGYYSVSVVGTSSTIHANNNRVINNTLDKFYYYGVYIYYQDTSLVEGNTITQRVGGSATCYGVSQSTNSWTNIRKNKVVIQGSSTNYGIYCTGCTGDVNLPIEWSNNMITCLNGTGTTYGMYPLNNGYLNIYHNSINVEAGSGTAGRGLYLNATTTGLGNVRVVNNIIASTGLGYAFEISAGAVTNNYFSEINYNNIYGTGAVLARYNNINETTLAGWISTAGVDSNSLSVNPQFVSPTDLHTSSQLMNDRAALGTGVSDDIDGDVRCPDPGCAGNTLRPDIGADEFFGVPITVDMGADVLVSPAQASCYTNSESVIVRIKNFNTQSIDFTMNPVTIYSSVTGPNGVVFTPVVLNTGSLAADSVMDVTFSTAYDMSVPGVYSFTYFTSEASDANPGNDTVNNAAITFTVGTIANTYAELCAGSTFDLTMEEITGPVQWQSFDNNNSVWVNETGIGFDSVVYQVTPVATTLYRALVCTTYPSATDTLVPVFVTPPTATSDTICNGEVAQLIAAGTGAKNWYSSISASNPIFTGDTFSIAANSDTTLYVDASVVLAGGTGTLKITEIDVDNTIDKIEIQNLSSQTINTNGWVVAVSNSYTVINTVNTTLWNLPATMAPGQVLYKTDATANNYWGSNLFWNPGQNGWAMIIDNNGVIRDLVIMNWPASSLPTFNAVINGFNITFNASDWVGDGVSINGIPGGTSINRVGNTDNNVATDFVWAPLTIGSQNANLSSIFFGGSCSSSRIPVNVKVEPAPVVNLGSDTTSCEGVVVLDAANTGNTFTWSTTEITQTITAATSGLYAVTVTSPNGCVGNDAINVNIAPYPVVNLGSDTLLCGGSIILSTSNIGNTFNWSTGSSSPFITVTSSGTYSVTVTTPAGCASNDTVLVTVNPAASVTLPNDTAQCGGAVVLDAGNSGSAYSWSDGATSQTITVTQTGNYSVVITDANNCTATDDVSVTINEFPVVDLGADTAQCGGTVVLDAGNIGSAYLWNTNAATQSLVVSASGTYAVEVTTSAGCSSTDTVDVTINANPTVTFNVADTVCADATAINLTASPSGGVFSGAGVSGATFNPADAGVGSRTITYSYTDNNGCSSSASDAIEVVVCVGIVEAENNITISIYPNPTSAIANISFAADNVRSLNIEIFASDGKLVGLMNNIQSGDQLNLEHLATGVYQVRVTANNLSVVKRLVIE